MPGRLAVGLAVLALFVVACTWTTTRPTAELAEPSAPPATDPSAHLPDDPPAPKAETDKLAGTPKVLIQDVVGATPDEAKAIFADIAKEIARCKAPASGVVRVRVKASGGDVRTTLKATSNDADVDQCVLTAVAVNVDNALEPSTSPSEDSPNLESVVTVSW
ncbi:MAG: hypothetical protein JRI68_15350 [Deltaproteobacteria bacterium]|nr:hypothetical protein [Deltaproteobacteria bacterium]